MEGDVWVGKRAERRDGKVFIWKLVETQQVWVKKIELCGPSTCIRHSTCCLLLSWNKKGPGFPMNSDFKIKIIGPFVEKTTRYCVFGPTLAAMCEPRCNSAQDCKRNSKQTLSF